jgi:hypothetical protein
MRESLFLNNGFGNLPIIFNNSSLLPSKLSSLYLNKNKEEFFMANACSFFSLVSDMAAESILAEKLSDFDPTIEVVEKGLLIKSEIFSCRPEYIDEYLSLIEDYSHHTFVGGANFSEGTAYYTEDGEHNRIMGFRTNADPHESLSGFKAVTAGCDTSVLNTIFSDYLYEELYFAEDELESCSNDPEDAEYFRSLQDECREIIEYLET